MRLHHYGPHFLATDGKAALTFTAAGRDEAAEAELLHDVWLYGLTPESEWPATADGVPGLIQHYTHTDGDVVPGGTPVELYSTGDLLAFVILAKGLVIRVNAGYDTAQDPQSEVTA